MANVEDAEYTETSEALDTVKTAPATLVATRESLMQPVGAGSAPAERSISIAYVGFRGAKSKTNLESLDAAGIKVGRAGDGQFYLHDAVPIKIDPFQLHLLQYYRAYTQVDEQGNVVDAVFENSQEAFDNDFREAIYASTIVVLPDGGGYVPATLQLRGGQTNALKDGLKLLGTHDKPGRAMNPTALAAAGGDWIHAAKALVPGIRFRLTIWSTAETPARGGEKFNQGHGQVKPTPKGEIEALNAWIDKNFDTSLKAVMTLNNARFEKIRRLAQRGV